MEKHELVGDVMKEKTEKLISIITLKLFWGVAVGAILPILVMWMTTIFYLQKTFIEEGVYFNDWYWQVMMFSFVCFMFVFTILSFNAMEGLHKACCEFYHKYIKKNMKS